MATDIANILSILFQRTGQSDLNITEIRLDSSQGQIIWPQTVTRTLTNLQVVYSSSTAILANNSNYAYLRATLTTTQGSSSTSQTVTLKPEIVGTNDKYVINDSSIRFNYNTYKTTEYSSILNQLFTGYYQIGTDKLYPTSGTTQIAVYLQGNQIDSSVQAYTTTSEVRCLINGDDEILVDGSTSGVVGNVTVYRTYSSTTTKYTYTSGASTGGVTTTGLHDTVNPTSVQSLTTGLTISGNQSSGWSASVTKNSSASQRELYMKATYTDNGSATSTNTCRVIQAANIYRYGAITITSFSYSVIPASGGTVTPTISYSQQRGWAPANDDATPITNDPSANISYSGATYLSGGVYAGSLGTTEHTTQTTVATVSATVSAHGQTSSSSSATVKQDINVIVSTSSEVKIMIDSQYVDSYSFTALSQTKNFMGYGFRTHTWSSGADSSSSASTSDLSISKSGTWVSISNWQMSISENTSTSSKSGSLTVSDGSYGSKTISLSQSAAIFALYVANGTTQITISEAAANPAFTLKVISTRNGAGYKPNVSIPGSSVTRWLNLVSNEVDPSDSTAYILTFRTNAYTGSSSRNVSITISQTSSSASSISYTVTQQYVQPSMDVNTTYITVGASGSATFDITTNKAWSINTTYSMCNIAGTSQGTSSTALTLNHTSGAAGTTTVSVSRNTANANYIVDIEITCDSLTTHVIVVPVFSITRNVSSWSLTQDSSTYHNAISVTNYPTITWTSTQTWLTGSGTDITASTNSGSSTRTGSIYATGSISNTYYGVSYSKSENTSSISVSQSAQATSYTIYVVISEQDLAHAYVSLNRYYLDEKTIPADLLINNIQITDQNNNTFYGSGMISSGNSSCVLTWSPSTPQSLGSTQNTGVVSWRLSPAPSNYTIGNSSVQFIS